MEDERLSTEEARARLAAMGLSAREAKERLDAMAACVILESRLARLAHESRRAAQQESRRQRQAQ
jgi:RNase H-fold protein (predicted Holliday junction resolvase)